MVWYIVVKWLTWLCVVGWCKCEIYIVVVWCGWQCMLMMSAWLWCSDVEVVVCDYGYCTWCGDVCEVYVVVECMLMLDVV